MAKLAYFILGSSWLGGVKAIGRAIKMKVCSKPHIDMDVATIPHIDMEVTTKPHIDMVVTTKR